ncbi:kinase-like domain-containing protein [Phialemonium atrogriseum]|uniref:Kinase-like domain-containing protein n=1 Tax=Phialemonium atrogriseum TaxID=1093897 RepID=A0AAJ0FMX7_9PEZI|nr:kinase-like domain-containing protein [Phialemonium atrogriseum]KAK1768718.1 kinase-like domain-containing protein [Phialemonium atrogriseum]
MTPQITRWSDFAHVSEEFKSATREFQYTMFAVVDADDQVMATLKPIPDSEMFPEWPLSDSSGAKQLTQAPLFPPTNVRIFIKRPNLSQYDVFKRYKVVHLLAQSLLEEAYTMEFLSKHPHPNIIRYHGCCSRRGYLTGIVQDCHSRIIDKKAFIDALESAIHHLHSLGWAHNDLNPTNVLVNDSESGGGMPVLIDFDSAREIGRLLGTFRGTTGWIDGQIEDYTTSKKEHDIFALEKMRV